jgi:hypothetical protein
MTLEGQDPETLDLFSTPSAIVVNLHRRVRFFSKTSHARQEVSWNETAEEMGTAVWWPSAGSRSSALVRHLEGELKLAKDLRPTSAMGHFSISVSLSLYIVFALFMNRTTTASILSFYALSMWPILTRTTDHCCLNR